ncbi:hypothetical protein [Halorussus sp. MSC15.2]|uniref:hypothetical protein n=1 Tax=Halorussus sp. MSC15.2 TaxID=2283638 RepID=UPI001F07A5E6|nr:hypothetical protein [Halorussus sp. MSC15.2]
MRAPELKHIYGSLQGPSSVSEVTSKFGRPAEGGGQKTDHVEESLRFLNTVDLVESPSGDIRDTVERINDRHFEGLAFEARLLYHCNQQEGRQSHFADIHRALMSEESRTVDAGRDNLRTILKRETDYDFSWTDEKLDMWVTLCEQLGLVSETEDGLVLSPCRALVHDALALAPMESGEGAEYGDVTVEDGEFRRALDWINDNLFTVFSERSGNRRVHPAVADVLRNMDDNDVLSLSAPGDAQNSVELPPQNLNDDVRGNRRSVTHVSIRPRPDETAYEYPLNQLLTRQ